MRISNMNISTQKWQLLFDSTKTYIFLNFFLLRKKVAFSLSTFASSKQGSMGERLKPAHC